MSTVRRNDSSVPARRARQAQAPTTPVAAAEERRPAVAARAWEGASLFEPAGTAVTVHEVRGASASEAAKVREAASRMQQVLRSAEFRQEVLALRGLINTEGLGNEEIYQRVLAGSEGATPGADHEADLKVALYSKWNPWSKEVAWSGAREPAIHLNRKFFGRAVSDVAGTLAHEWSHQLGFNDSGANPNSVPYRIGDIVARLAEHPEALTPLAGGVPADPPAAPVEPPQARPTLFRGAQGADVEALQQLLLDAGFSPGPVDGDFGRYTERALEAFQRAKGLPASGVADAATWAALQAGR